MLRLCYAAPFLCLLLLAGCSGAPAPETPAAASASAAPTTSKRPGKLPPLPGSGDGPAEETKAPQTADENGFTRACGTVRAASGAQLRVILGEGATSCPDADRLVRAFHRKIKQPSGSSRPAAAEVDGWRCVSGPPASQGGTTCTRGGATVMAAVITAE